MKAILIMLSNYFHDLAVGILFSAMLLTWYLHRSALEMGYSPGQNTLVKKVVQRMHYAALGAWVWILIGGIIRTINYRRYEWLPAAGRGQVTALVLKHIVLAAVAIYGAVTQYRLYRLYLKE
ncbi:MAG: hypothetical protein H0Z38_03695 [Firmicutes bacterium]|nr:hypothetical protein [Bacillota bacterium]